MKNKYIQTVFSLAFIFVAIIASAQTPSADAILGTFLNEDQDAHVQISQENGKYFGRIVWLKEPNEPATGLPKLDDDNEDEALRSRPVMGLVILKDFIYDGDGEWEDGTIYDPKNGKTYDCYMEFDEEGVLKIRGYIGVSWIGRSTYWTRVSK